MLGDTAASDPAPTDSAFGDTGAVSADTGAPSHTGGLTAFEVAEQRVAALCPSGPDATGFDAGAWDPLGDWLLAEVVHYAADGSVSSVRTYTAAGDHTEVTLRAGGRLQLDFISANGSSSYAAYDLTWLRGDTYAVAMCDAEFMYTVYGTATDPLDPDLDRGDWCTASAADPDTMACVYVVDGQRTRALTYTRL